MAFLGRFFNIRRRRPVLPIRSTAFSPIGGRLYRGQQSGVSERRNGSPEDFVAKSTSILVVEDSERRIVDSSDGNGLRNAW